METLDSVLAAAGISGDGSTDADLLNAKVGGGGGGTPAGRIPVGARVDPGRDNLIGVNRYGQPATRGQRVFYLTQDAANAFSSLRGDAMAAGFDNEDFTLTSGYRSAGRQAGLAAQARAQHGADAATWVAQGRSEHITGNAFDLNLGIANSSANAQSGAFNNLGTYQWLQSNAANYGLNAYAREPWHWSYNVTGP